MTFQIRKKTNTFSIFIIRLSKRIDDFNSTFNCLASLKISKTTTKFDVPKMNDLSWAKFELQLRNIIQMMSVAFLEISRYKISWKCICVRNQRKNAAFKMPASSSSNWIQLSCQISSLSSFVAFTLPQIQLLLSSF